MDKVTIITIKNREKDGVSNVSVDTMAIDGEGKTVAFSFDTVVATIERAKMQMLGQSFMDGAKKSADANQAVDRALLQTAMSSLNMATETMQRLFPGKKALRRRKTS